MVRVRVGGNETERERRKNMGAIMLHCDDMYDSRVLCCFDSAAWLAHNALQPLDPSLTCDEATRSRHPGNDVCEGGCGWGSMVADRLMKGLS